MLFAGTLESKKKIESVLDMLNEFAISTVQHVGIYMYKNIPFMVCSNDKKGTKRAFLFL